MANRSYIVRLLLEVGAYKAGAREAIRANEALDKSTKKTRKNLTTLTAGLTAGGLALVAGFAVVGNTVRKFDKQMSEVIAVTDTAGMSAENAAAQFDLLRAAAIKTGKDTVFTATEAARAEAELAKAGISTSQILGGALTGSLSLASAGSIELADAATIAAQAMNTFGLSGVDVNHIADVLAAGANKSAADVTQLAAAMRQVGQIAFNAGLTLEDTVGTLAAFADNALYGSDAGTSFKSMLQQLQAPSDKSASLMRQLGINLYDAQGKFIGITKFADQLQDSLGGLTQSQRDYAIAQIFGTDAARAAIVLYREGGEGIRQYIRAVDDQGAAAETARKKLDNLDGDVEKLTGSLESLTLQSSGGVNAALRGMTQAATDMVDSFSLLPRTLQSGLVIFAGIAGGALLIAAAAIKARNKLRELNLELAASGKLGGIAATGLQRMAGAIGRVGAGITTLQFLGLAFGHDINPAVEDTVKQLEAFNKTGDKSGQVLKNLGYDLGTLDSGKLTKFGNALAGTLEGLTNTGGIFDESLEHARQRLTAIDAGLAALVQKGQTGEAAQIFNKIAEQADKGGVSVKELSKALPTYIAAVNAAAEAQHGAAESSERYYTGLGDAKSGTSQLADETDDLAGSLQEAVSKGESLVSVFDALNGVAINYAQAEIDVREKLDDFTASLHENGKTLDIDTEKGRENLSGILAIIQASRDAAQAKYDESGSIEQATATYQQHIDKLRQELQQAGFTKKQIDDLIISYGKLPPLAETKITAPGAAQVLTDLQKINDYLAKISFGVIHLNSFGAGNAGFTTGYRGQRHGGINYAKAGVLSDAGIYQPVKRGALYGFAEPETGGEAFIPKNGDARRSMAILSEAARWYGARVAPASGGSGDGAAGATSVTYQIYPQKADFGRGELAALSAAQDIRLRVGRPR